MYKILFTHTALKDLQNINKSTQKRIAAKLKEYSTAPFKYSKKLINSNLGSYRFRIGDYRVIFDIEENSIVILRIGHRKNIYK